jgi:hypothetical protein
MDSLSLSPRKLYFVSGNPCHEVKSGVIEFYEDVAVDCGVTDKRIGFETHDELLCMLSVPSFMIHQVIFYYPFDFISCYICQGSVAISRTCHVRHQCHSNTAAF